MGERHKKEEFSGESNDVVGNILDELKEVVPAAVSEEKLDCQKLKELLGQSKIADSAEKYDFTWAGKREAFKLVRKPTTKTLKPIKEESINFTETENIFIEGDNLEVLKILQKSYYEKVKMIYIDPPYNTGKDFVYKDNFKESKQKYEKKTRQRNSEGKLVSNPETGGRYHSNWLTMMYPRLFLARNLLKEDGVVFVSIDDNEVHNLRLVMNEIFGEENFISSMIWKSRTSRQYSERFISSQTEYVIVFAKNKGKWKEIDEKFNRVVKEIDKFSFSNPDNDPRGKWTSSGIVRNDGRKEYTFETPSGKKYCEPWLYSQENMKKLKEKSLLWFGVEGSAKPRKKNYWKDYTGKVPSNILKDEFYIERKKQKIVKEKYYEVGTTESGTNELKGLFDTSNSPMPYPKPSSLLKHLLKISSLGPKDIVMDFFAGSCPLAQATYELNFEDQSDRKFVCVQIPEKCKEGSHAKKQGYNTISELAKERIRLASQKMRETKEVSADADLGFKAFEVVNSNITKWKTPADKKQLDEQLQLQTSALDKNASNEQVLYELIIKEGFTPNANVKQVENDGRNFFEITEGELLIYVTLEDELNEDNIRGLHLDSETTLVCLDSALSDTVKDNISRLCNLKTV